MDIKAIQEKIKDSNSMAETKKILTEEELVAALLHDCVNSNGLVEGDEQVIAQVLQVLGERNYTVSYIQQMLEATKELVPFIATFQM